MAGRPCSICTSQQRARIEAQIVSGESVSTIATEFPLSVAGIGRHIRNHLRPELRDRLPQAQVIDAADLASRIQAIADGAREAREHAMETGAVQSAMRAGDAELRALAAMADRLGIDAEDVIDNLRSGRALAQAVGRIATSNREFARAIVEHLRREGAAGEEMADGLERHVITTTERKEIR